MKYPIVSTYNSLPRKSEYFQGAGIFYMLHVDWPFIICFEKQGLPNFIALKKFHMDLKAQVRSHSVFGFVYVFIFVNIDF